MSIDDDEQTELTEWVDSADEGDETLAWVKTGTSGDEKGDEKREVDRVGWMLDLVQKPEGETATGRSTTRRVFLKFLGSSAIAVGGIAFKGVALPRALENFWPNALAIEESEAMWSLSTLQTLLTDYQLGWEEFKTRSKKMLYDPEVVSSYDDVHLLSVFYRAIGEDLIEAIMRSSNRANSVYVYFADPASHRTKKTPALELYEDIELRSFRSLYQNTFWARYYNKLIEHNVNNRVPHPDNSILNRIRALANALRAIQMGGYLTYNQPNVKVRLIDHHEVSLRGRLIDDHKAAFLMNPKATIGTTAPRIGFITDQESVISELHQEREQITNKRTYGPEDLVDLSETTRMRGETLLDAAVESDDVVLKPEQVKKISNKLDQLTIHGTTRFDTNKWVKEFDKDNRTLVNDITSEVNKIAPFTEPEKRQNNWIYPGHLYNSVEEQVVQTFP